MSETAAELIASAFANTPAHRTACPICSWSSGMNYNPGDARGSLKLHLRLRHDVESRKRDEADVDHVLAKRATKIQ